MEVIRSVAEMSQRGASIRLAGQRLGLVPTMGFLHEGHISLVRLISPKCDVRAASIFVNPTQFGPGEDFNKYPRDEDRDFRLLEEVGCEIVFCPTPEEIYPDGHQAMVDLPRLSQPLCGQFRPGHFRGVSTVVLKFLHITHCSIAAFGLKDYQQAMIIRQMVHDLNLDVELLFGETVREADGLAMSSRNTYLTPQERKQALAIPRALDWAREQASAGAISAAALANGVKERLVAESALRVQYIEIVDADTLEKMDAFTKPALLAVAVFAGKTRLIDNIRLSPPPASAKHPGNAKRKGALNG